MKRFLIALTALILLNGFTLSFLEAATHDAYVSGSFYPSDKNELNSMIDGFLSKVPEEESRAEGALLAMIVPHAGYIYSGQTAAFAYQLLLDRHFDTVVLIGPYHKGVFNGASIWKTGSWGTPLGDVAVDEALAKAIAAESSVFNFSENAHSTEHSLETQIPFLQKTLKNFKIVPILVSDPSPDNTRELAAAIYKNIQGKSVLVVASTDMSHYHDDTVARLMDARTIELVQRKDTKNLLNEMKSNRSELCGLAATLTVLELSKKVPGAEVRLLNYSNSGDSTGDKSRVVGYGAFSVSVTADASEGIGREQGE